eukprot:1185286-Prorocentrum_minimum.AAC.1
MSGRGRPVLPAAQRGASCPVDHPCPGPLLLEHAGRALHLRVARVGGWHEAHERRPVGGARAGHEHGVVRRAEERD